jgi:hypothetical protein
LNGGTQKKDAVVNKLKEEYESATGIPGYIRSKQIFKKHMMLQINLEN